MLAHVFALTGFLLLRRDRPDWPRPIKLSAIWVPIAALLALANRFIVSVHLSAASSTPTSTATAWDKTEVGLIVLAVSLVLYAFRHVVQDRTGLRLREETPATPEEAARMEQAAASA